MVLGDDSSDDDEVSRKTREQKIDDALKIKATIEDEWDLYSKLVKRLPRVQQQVS